MYQAVAGTAASGWVLVHRFITTAAQPPSRSLMSLMTGAWSSPAACAPARNLSTTSSAHSTTASGMICQYWRHARCADARVDAEAGRDAATRPMVRAVVLAGSPGRAGTAITFSGPGGREDPPRGYCGRRLPRAVDLQGYPGRLPAGMPAAWAKPAGRRRPGRAVRE